MIDRIVALSKGNPGAATVLGHMRAILPPTDLEHVIKYMEKEQLTGPDIWVLYKDTHGQNIAKFTVDLIQKSGALKDYEK